MIRTVFALAAALLFASPALADDAANSAPPSPPPCLKDGAAVPAQNIALAHDVITASKATDHIALILDNMMPAMMDMVHQADPDVPADVLLEMRNDLREEMEKSVPNLVQAEACVYAQHFTADDMKALVAFYTSPLGQRLLAATPDIAKDSMAVGRAWGEQSAHAAMERVMAKFRKPEDKT